MKALIVLALVSLAGCSDRATGGYDQPAASQTALATPAERPAVRIGSIRGATNGATRGLRDALEASLRQRGIDVVRRRGPAVVELTGRLAALNEGNVTTYSYEWRMANKQGWSAKPVVGFERTPGGSSNLWAGISGGTTRRMSERIARRIALALGVPG